MTIRLTREQQERLSMLKQKRAWPREVKKQTTDADIEEKKRRYPNYDSWSEEKKRTVAELEAMRQRQMDKRRKASSYVKAVHEIKSPSQKRAHFNSEISAPETWPREEKKEQTRKADEATLKRYPGYESWDDLKKKTVAELEAAAFLRRQEMKKSMIERGIYNLPKQEKVLPIRCESMTDAVRYLLSGPYNVCIWQYNFKSDKNCIVWRGYKSDALLDGTHHFSSNSSYRLSYTYMNLSANYSVYYLIDTNNDCVYRYVLKDGLIGHRWIKI